MRVAIRKSASALVLSGHPVEEITSLGYLVGIERVRVILRFFIERNGGEPPTWLYGLTAKLVAIGRHHVELGTNEITALTRLKSKMKPEQQGMTEKNKLRLGQFDDARNVALLLRLPLDIAARTKTKKEPSSWDAIAMMNAVAVEMLLACPMRIGNLAALDLDRHLTWRGHGRGRWAALMIPAAETKNGVAVEVDLPAETSQLIRLYIDRYRGLASAQPRSWLFPNRAGTGHRLPAPCRTRSSRSSGRRPGWR